MKHILVVDDEEALRELVGINLTNWGYRVTTASTGEGALELVTIDDTIDLVVTDIRMPGRYNGIELLDEIKKQFPFKPVVIFVSGFADITIEDAYNKGAAGFLDKPFKSAELREITEAALKDFPRYTGKYEKADVELEVKLTFKSLDETIMTHTLSLGQGGMFLLSSKSGTLKSLVEFEINFSDGPPDIISGTGEIVWIRGATTNNIPEGLGVKFINLPEAHEKFIDSFVKKQRIISFIPKL